MGLKQSKVGSSAADDAEAEEQDFYFVRADKLRGCLLKSLPPLQVMLTDPRFEGWVVRKTLTRTKAYQGEYTREFLTVSHRWELPENPDPDGLQLEAVKDFLNADLSTTRERDGVQMRDKIELTALQRKVILRLKYVWFDFWTMPQVIKGKPRSPNDDRDFKRMLKNCNMLYLGMKVLIIMDGSYLSRFWTQFESWLSYQKATSEGLLRTTANIQSQFAWTYGDEVDELFVADELYQGGQGGGLRCGVICIRSADIRFEGMKLYQKLSQMNADEISSSLAHKDVLVTSNNDKIVQLKRIRQFDDEVRRAYAQDVSDAEALQLDATSGVPFWFLTRDFVLKQTKPLGAHEDLRKQSPNSLVCKTLSRKAMLKGEYAGEICSISHRWMTSSEPDPDGEQLKAIKLFLNSKAGQNTKLIWYDFSCFPQGSAGQTADQLPHVGLLFLGMSVLILLDLSYISRFWTQYEAWLSMQVATPTGLTSAVGTKHEHHHVICILNTAAQSDMFTKMLTEQWATKTPEQSYKFLSKPDVTVTNQRDKAVQLAVITKLDEEARSLS